MAKSVSNKTPPANPSASNLVRLWLKQKPFMHYLVREGLVNYTALAQKLAAEGFATGKRPVAALRAALLRSRNLELGEFQPFGRNDVLHDSQFEIRSDVTVVQSTQALGMPVIAISSSKHSVTSIVDAQETKPLPKGAKIIGQKLVLVTIYSGDRMETESGVLATVLMHLALQQVNVVEITSCGPDTLLVIEPKDLATTLSVLQGLMSAEKKSGGAKALFSYAKVEKSEKPGW